MFNVDSERKNENETNAEWGGTSGKAGQGRSRKKAETTENVASAFSFLAPRSPI